MINVYIVSGFLGSGKTTFIQKLLSEKKFEKVMLLENEFGEVGVDGSFFDSSLNVKEINNGCICCSLQGDFADALEEIEDMGVVAEMADDVMVMYKGRVVEHGPVEEVFKNPLHPYTRDLLNSVPRMDKDVDRLNTIEGNVPSLKDMPKGCSYSTRCKDCMEHCSGSDPETIQYSETHSVRCWKYCAKEEA